MSNDDRTIRTDTSTKPPKHPGTFPKDRPDGTQKPPSAQPPKN
jgi:hypothetical protein